MFGSMFKPPLNGEPDPPEPELMVRFYVWQIFQTERRVRFCVRQNSGRTELNRTSASLARKNLQFTRVNNTATREIQYA